VIAGAACVAATRFGVEAAGQNPLSAGTSAKADAGDLAPRIDRLEAGVRAQEGVRAVKRLQHTYGHYLDTGLWSDLAELFTDDAVAQFQGTTVRGKAELRKHFMSEAGRTVPGLAAGQLNAHLILQPIVTLGADGTSAKGAWHEVAMLGQFGKSASWRGGVYENEYILDKGVWKISRLQYFLQYSGAYDEYGHRAPPKWGIPYHFEAAHVGVTIPAAALQAASTVPAGTSPGSRLAQLRSRVEALNDETSVQNLQHSYGYYLDRKLWDDVVDLFADDGSLEIAGHGVYVGKAGIRRALETLYGSSLRTGELFDHINLATVVTVTPDGRTAGARTSQLGQIGLNGEFARWELATLENEFVKSPRGTWQIKTVRYYPRLATDYDKGWGSDAKPFPAPAPGSKPDRQAQAFESYPKPFTVAFHYPNPVTGKAVRYPSGPQSKVQVLKPSPGVLAALPGTSDHGQSFEPGLAEVTRQLAIAIGVDATENLNSSYGYYIDESAWDQMADTYSLTQGAKEITGAGTYVGQERIRKVLNLRGPQGGRTANFFTIHQLTQPVIHVADDGMSARARLRLFQSGGNADGSSGSWIGGIYENTAVFENGEWKFGVQDLHHIFNASYRNGWGRVGAAARGATPGGGRAGTPPAGGQRAAPPPAPDGPLAPAATAAGAGAAAGGARGAAGRDVQGGGITQGLGGAAQPSRFIKEFPPDKPIRARQYAFPEIVEPAFHYKNPVSGRMPKELLP
jgi:hypothetical protein